MDIGDCNSEFLISFSEDNPCRLTHFLLILSTCKRRPSQPAIERNCVQLKQYRQWIDWMRKNWEQPQMTPVWATSKTLLLPPSKNKEWHGAIPQILRNVPQKCRSWSSTSFNSANKNYTSHTHYWLPKHKSDGNAHYSLEDSATEPFLPHWRSNKNKQSNAQWHAQQWQQDLLTN